MARVAYRRAEEESSGSDGEGSAASTSFSEVHGELEERRYTFDEVFAQETERIEELRSGRQSESGRERFSLAFSGGGIRAAAFQAGVLWRLAEEDRLQDVDYFTAVSGGGYIASAFTTHVLKEPRPDGCEDLKTWYLRVVAKTLKRMQTNAGDFVRDCFTTPGYSDEPNSGPLPRLFDLPILLCVLGMTLIVNPLFFILCFLVPFTILVEEFFGASMRASFCRPPGADWTDMLFKFAHTDRVIFWLLGLLLASVVVAILRVVLPSCKLRRVEGQKRAQAPFLYLMGHASAAMLKRIIWLTIFFMTFIFIVPVEESFRYSHTEVASFCSNYVHQYNHQTRADGSFRCSDFYKGSLWFRDPHFVNYTNHNILNAISEFSAEGSSEEHGFPLNAVLALCLLLGLSLTCSVCLMPIIGSSAFMATVAVAGPVMLAGVCMMSVSYVVYGPLTGNLSGMAGPYDDARCKRVTSLALGVAMLLIPFYEEIRGGLHHYYKRCLRQNFFANGEDVCLRQVGRNPYAPFLILTGTSNDYQPPGDTDKISELSFSALHTGGEETGYYLTPTYRSLSKVAAITGAGCLDAISLSMSDALTLRFWLEVLNLTWGDYIILGHLGWFACLSKPFGRWSGHAFRFFQRLPAALLWVLIFGMLRAGWLDASSGDQPTCHRGKSEMAYISRCFAALFCLSFYSFVPICDMLALSPLIRQLQQVMRYFFVGEQPPRMLYMTDGGVKDCTSIIQLLWRRRTRILLALAGADPRDELGVLKTAFQVARDLKLATFYDPEDPRADLEVLLERWKNDKEHKCLHIGISYCWAEKPGMVGHLFIVKNRLPPSCEGPIRPLLTEQEIITGQGEDGNSDGEWDRDAWGDLQNSDLGPFGCCDCCHTGGLNCGPKFPHGTFTGYLYLTPTYCSSLMRLGYMASKDAIHQVAGVHGRPMDVIERGLGPA